jgi:hypothetical protein
MEVCCGSSLDREQGVCRKDSPSLKLEASGKVRYSRPGPPNLPTPALRAAQASFHEGLDDVSWSQFPAHQVAPVILHIARIDALAVKGSGIDSLKPAAKSGCILYVGADRVGAFPGAGQVVLVLVDEWLRRGHNSS